jgi:replicative DNA helicase
MYPNANALPVKDETSVSETALAYCCLTDRNALQGTIDALSDGFDEVYNPIARYTLIASRDLLLAGKPADYVTVAERLKAEHGVDVAAFSAFVAEAEKLVPSAQNWPTYVEEVTVAARKRLLHRVVTEAKNALETNGGSYENAIESLRRIVLETCSPKNRAKKLSDVLVEGARDLYDGSAKHITGIPSGLSDLDRLTRGFKGGAVTVIAARPSIGKSALASQILLQAALQSVPVAYFTLEMTATEVAARLLRTQLLTLPPKKEEIDGAYSRLNPLQFWIDDTAGLTITQLCSRMIDLQATRGVRLFAVDYMQLVHCDRARRNENREREVAEISRAIKKTALQLNTPVLLVSQLNREPERKERRPTLSDLRESGAIEQDADQVILLYAPKVEDEFSEDGIVPVRADLAKNRNGPTGIVRLTFCKPKLRFYCESQSESA